MKLLCDEVTFTRIKEPLSKKGNHSIMNNNESYYEKEPIHLRFGTVIIVMSTVSKVLIFKLIVLRALKKANNTVFKSNHSQLQATMINLF